MRVARDEHWTLDKRIPLAFIIALLAQLVGFAWYASKLDSRIEAVEHKQSEAKTRLDSYDRDARNVGERLVRLEEKQSATLEILQRIERSLARAH